MITPAMGRKLLLLWHETQLICFNETVSAEGAAVGAHVRKIKNKTKGNKNKQSEGPKTDRVL
jgi:hypothetical protein